LHAKRMEHGTTASALSLPKESAVFLKTDT
jgi:hypothetical protein